jgi:hypothetical protein
MIAGDPVELALVEVVDLVAELPHAREHPEQLGHRAHLADGLHLGQEVLEGEVVAGLELRGHLRGLLGVERLLGLLDQREHVAHAEDARGHPVGVEDVEVVELLAVAGEHHLAAGDLRHRQARAAAGVAVELGQHDAVEADAVEERLRGRDGVLADHRVDDEEHLVGAYGVADVGGLPHQLGVDARGGRRCRRRPRRTAGPARARWPRARRRPGRPLRCRARARRPGRRRALPTTCSCCTALGRWRSAATRTGCVPLSLEPAPELAGERRLARALQAREHDHRRRRLRHPQPAGLAAEDVNELLVDDLDDLLAGLSACDTSTPRARSLTPR